MCARVGERADRRFRFPEIVEAAAESLSPHRIATFPGDARLAHLGTTSIRSEQEADVTRARLALARSAQIVLRNGMTILGITSPERM